MRFKNEIISLRKVCRTLPAELPERRISMDKKVFSDGSEIPMGLGYALMQNPSAMEYFSALPQDLKQTVIDKTGGIHSKKEMQKYVDNLVSAPDIDSFNGPGISG